MKKLYLITAALLALSVVSCEKEANTPEDNIDNNNKNCLIATFGEQTKSIYDNSGYTLRWETGDKIIVNTSDGEKVFTYSGEPTDGEAKFENTETGFTVVTGEYGYAVFHRQDKTTVIDGTTLKPNYPYTYSYGKMSAPMIARVNAGEKLQFTHLGGVLKVTYKYIPPKATKVVLAAPGGSDDSGDYKISYTMKEVQGLDTATPYIRSYIPDGGAGTTISVDITSLTNAQRASDDGVDFYIPLPVGPKTGDIYPKINVCLQFADGSVVPGSSKTASNVAVSRASVTKMNKPIALTKYTLRTVVGAAGRATSTTHVTGSFNETKLFAPRGIVKLPGNQIMLCDQNDALMFLDMPNSTCTKVTYNPISTTAVPWNGCYHNGLIYFVDKSQGRLYTCDPSTKAVTYTNVSTGNYSPMAIDFSAAGDAYVVIRDAYGLFKYAGGITGTKTKFGNFQISGVNIKPIAFVIDPNGDFIVSTADNGFRLYKVPASTGTPAVVAGNGTKATNLATLVDGKVSSATFTANTYGLAFDNEGNLYVGDQFSIRKITFGANGWDDAIITTVISNGTSSPKDGVGADAAVNNVGSMVFSDDYSKLYVTDQNAGKFYEITIE